MTTERYLLFASPKVCTICVVFQAVFIKKAGSLLSLSNCFKDISNSRSRWHLIEVVVNDECQNAEHEEIVSP
jgi:hypothetical protein